MPDLVARSKSTFCPQVCACCYWERKYKLLMACHKVLRSQLIRIVGSNKKLDNMAHSADESTDEGGAMDLVEMMEGDHR